MSASDDDAEKRMRGAFATHLVQATELLAELLASIEEDRVIDTSSLSERIREVNFHIWKIRWELGVLPSGVDFVEEDSKTAEDDDEPPSGKVLS